MKLRNCYDEKYNALANFQEKTTYSNDFQWYCEFQEPFHRWNYSQCENSIKSKRPIPQPVRINLETLTKAHKDAYLPFNLLHRPRPIIDPYILPTKFPKDDKQNVFTEISKHYMTPAVNLDNLTDTNLKNLIMKRMYTTEWKETEEIAANYYAQKDFSHLLTLDKNITPVDFKVALDKPIKADVKIAAKNWENKQLKASIDTNKSFWMIKGPSVICGACVDRLKDVVPAEIKQEIRQLIKDENLRQCHDKLKPSYTGYVPKTYVEVPLAKKQLPPSHPMLSLSQILASRKSK